MGLGRGGPQFTLLATPLAVSGDEVTMMCVRTDGRTSICLRWQICGVDGANDNVNHVYATSKPTRRDWPDSVLLEIATRSVRPSARRLDQ